MDTRRVDSQADEKIRDLYRESALRTDMALFAERLRERLAGERRPRAGAAPRRPGRRSQLRGRPWKLALAVSGGLVVLGAVGFGVYAAVEHFGRHTPVLVIGDDSMLGSTGVASAYDAVLPAGVSAVVGTSGTSLWCLSRELGFTTLDAGARPVFVATGTTGDLVAYSTEAWGEVFLWDSAETGADGGVTSLAVGDASRPITVLSMSPDGTKLAVARSEQTTDTVSWPGHLYIVDLAADSSSEWQWTEENAPPWGATHPGGFVWSPASDAFYISFEVPAGVQSTDEVNLTYRCDVATGATSVLANLRAVRDANAKGDVVWLRLDYGQEGLSSSSYADPSVTIQREGELTSIEPATQTTFGPLFISADGESVVLQGDAYDESDQVYGVFEVLRHGDEGWRSAQVVAPASLPSPVSLGFAGGDRFYFAAGPRLESSDDATHWQLGTLDPATGEYQMCEELPVQGNSRLVGLRTQPSTPAETPEDTSTTIPATTSTTERSSAPAQVTSTASLPLTQVDGTTVFSAGWGSGSGEFGVEREDAWGLFVNGPGSMWVSPDERLYILDPMNRRVQVVGADGTVEPAIPIDMGYPIDVAAALDGTVLVLGSDPTQGSVHVIQAYSPAGHKVGEYPAHFGDAYPTEFVADETTVYCSYFSDVGKDSTDAPLEVTKYVPVYRDGELLDPAAGWETAAYDQPLSQGLSLRVGDHLPGDGTASESIGNIHVYAGDVPVFSSELMPADYGPVTGIATDDGEVLVSRGWIVSEDPGATLAHAVWAFSPAGTPIRRVEVLQPLHSSTDSSGGSRARLSRSGAFFVLTTTSDGLTVVRYDLGMAVGAAELKPMSDDFGFAAKYGPGARNAIDTIAGTCRKDLVDNGVAETGLTLTSEELQRLYDGLRELDIFLYPSHFQPPAGDPLGDAARADYYLEIRSGGAVTKFVVWQDTGGSTRGDAVALRQWFAELRGIIEAKPEWQALPPAVGVHDG